MAASVATFAACSAQEPPEFQFSRAVVDDQSGRSVPVPFSPTTFGIRFVVPDVEKAKDSGWISQTINDAYRESKLEQGTDIRHQMFGNFVLNYKRDPLLNHAISSPKREQGVHVNGAWIRSKSEMIEALKFHAKELNEEVSYSPIDNQILNIWTFVNADDFAEVLELVESGDFDFAFRPKKITPNCIYYRVKGSNPFHQRAYALLFAEDASVDLDEADDHKCVIAAAAYNFNLEPEAIEGKLFPSHDEFVAQKNSADEQCVLARAIKFDGVIAPGEPTTRFGDQPLLTEYGGCVPAKDFRLEMASYFYGLHPLSPYHREVEKKDEIGLAVQFACEQISKSKRDCKSVPN